MRNILVILSFVFYFFESNGQNIDSLKGLFQKDNQNFELCGKIAWSYISSNPDSYYHYVKKEISIAEKENDKYHISLANCDLSNFYYMNGDYGKSLELNEKYVYGINKSGNEKVYFNYILNYVQTLIVLNKINNALKLLVSIENNLNKLQQPIDRNSILKRINYFKTQSFYAVGMYDKAIEVCLQNDSLLSAIGDSKLKSKNLNELGNIYSLLGNKLQAKNYHLKAFQLVTENKDSNSYLIGCANIANSYLMLDSINNALKYLNFGKAFLDRKLTNQDGSTELFINFAKYFYKLKQFDSSIYYYQKAQSVAFNNKDAYTIAQIKYSLAEIEISKGNINHAINILLEVDQIFTEENDIEALAQVYNNLSNCFKNLGDYQKAYKFQSKFIQMSDSLINIEKNKAIIREEIKFETEKKDKLINKQALVIKQKEIAQRNIYIFSILGLLTSIFVLYNFIFWNRRKTLQIENEKINLKYNLIKGKVLPHFSGNVLNNIAYLFESNQQQEGIDYLVKYSELNKDLLRTTELSCWELKEEINFLQNYIDLEKLRYGNKLEFDLNSIDGVALQVHVPILITHTFCKNSIEHGIMSVNGNGKLSVQISEIENSILIRITDNGIGIEEAKKRNIHSSGYGLDILTKQLEISNKNNSTPISFDLDSNANGTVARIVIPKNYNYTI